MAKTIDINAIRDYLIEVGYKIEYPILVNAFKKYLYNPDPNVQAKVRTQFKDYVNKLATVSLENNMKFILLRPEFRPDNIKTLNGNQEPRNETPKQLPFRPIIENKQQQYSPKQIAQTPPKQKQQQLYSTKQNPQQQQSLYSPKHVPQLYSPKQNIIQQQQQPAFMPTPPPRVFKTMSLPANSTPPPVPQHRKQINSNSNINGVHKQQSLQNSNQSFGQPLSQPLPLSIQNHSNNGLKWSIEACNCNYNGLLTLLRKDQKFAYYKDIVNGYTALHWAAKFGNLDIIKLIAGTYGVSTNIKSSAGYTPLHVAAMFNRVEAADLLLKCYKANPDIRDHSGKRAKQYWPKQDLPKTTITSMTTKILTPFKY